MFDLTETRPNPLGLSDEQFALWDELLAWLDAGGDDKCRFDYAEWPRDEFQLERCGSCACIGGWVNLRLGFGESHFCFGQTRRALGLHEDMGEALFLGGLYEHSGLSRDPTAAEAASCVRTLLTEGIVDWPRAMVAA